MSIILKPEEKLEKRYADEEACYHSRKQKECWYYKEGRCTCNRVGNTVRIDGVPVQYI